MPDLARLALAAGLVLEAGTGAWSVGVTTSGGFVGTGRGEVLVRSSGELTAQGPGGRPKRPVVPCKARISAAEMQRIAAAVEGSQPAGWAAVKLKGAAPDAFGYVLELRRGDQTHEVAWYDNTRGRMPADLAELYGAVEAAWQRAVKGCDAS